MSLSIDELVDLEEDILAEFPDKITGVLTKLNRMGQLEELLNMLEMSHLLDKPTEIESFKNGKIVVLGASSAKEKVLTSIAEDLGISKDRLEFCLDYDAMHTHNFRKYQYAPKYRVILFGPMPHSGTGKGESSSIITEIESGMGYPRVERLISNNALKITKTNFREKLEALIAEGYI